jgi:hypothetical protein
MFKVIDLLFQRLEAFHFLRNNSKVLCQAGEKQVDIPEFAGCVRIEISIRSFERFIQQTDLLRRHIVVCQQQPLVAEIVNILFEQFAFAGLDFKLARFTLFHQQLTVKPAVKGN